MSGSVREASVKKGKLILRARKKDGIYRCGGIWSLGKIAFGPGHRIEVGARSPTGARSLARHLADAGKTDISGVARLWGD